MTEKTENDKVTQDQVDEVKASFGVDASVADPTGKKAVAPGDDGGKQDGDITQGSSGEKAPQATGPQTKAAAISLTVKHLGKLKEADVLAAYADLTADKLEEDDSEDADDDTTEIVEIAKVEKITADDIGDHSADITAMFAGSDMSEDFAKKATEIFETAVVALVNGKIAEISEQVQLELTETSTTFEAELTEKIDTYLDYVVEQWMDENRLAVDQGLRTEIAESLLTQMKAVFDDHYINIPDSKVDVVDEMAATIAQLEAKLNETIESSIELKKANVEFERAAEFAESVDGLTETQIAKMESLSEAVEYVDADQFRAKLKTIRESYFDAGGDGGKEELNETVKQGTLDDAPVDIDEENGTKSSSPRMAAYMESISRQVNA